MGDGGRDGADSGADDGIWDDAKAAAIKGATVLISMTYRRKSGDERVQMHGTVTGAERHSVVTVALGGTRSGEIFTLPSDTSVFESAGLGHYRLRGTGEVVADPDYLVRYTVQMKEDDPS